MGHRPVPQPVPISLHRHLPGVSLPPVSTAAPFEGSSEVKVGIEVGRADAADGAGCQVLPPSLPPFSTAAKPWSHRTGLWCRVCTVCSWREHNVSMWGRVLEAVGFLRAHAGKWGASWDPGVWLPHAQLIPPTSRACGCP